MIANNDWLSFLQVAFGIWIVSFLVEKMTVESDNATGASGLFGRQNVRHIS